MKQITLYPTAKINIGLYIFEKRADGFHDLESIFCPVGEHNSSIVPDRLQVTVYEGDEGACNPAPDTGQFAVGLCGKVRMIESGLAYPGEPQDNICVKAYNLLDADFFLPPVEIFLDKHIPVGAGLGGGSSDGVCTLRALNELCRLGISEEKMLEYAARLGSDCPFFVKNEPMLVTGIGEILQPLTVKGEIETAYSQVDVAVKYRMSAKNDIVKRLTEEYRFEIVFSPDCFVSTSHAYSIVPKRKRCGKALGNTNTSGSCGTPYTPLAELVKEPVENWQGKIVNDFETPVFAEFPQLQEIKDRFLANGASYVSMTGSGSAIYAIFKK